MTCEISNSAPIGQRGPDIAMNKSAIKDYRLLLRGVAQELPTVQRDLQEEFECLLARSVDDPPMALGRARRVVEVLITDRYVACNQLTPPFRKQLKPLYNMIEELLASHKMTPVEAALCHAIRLEGNRVLHYLPNVPNESKKMQVSTITVAQTLQKLAEIAETSLLGEQSVYASSLGEPFAVMSRKLQNTVVPILDQKAEGPFPLAKIHGDIPSGTLQVIRPVFRNHLQINNLSTGFCMT
jgi:hypothetical protein